MLSQFVSYLKFLTNTLSSFYIPVSFKSFTTKYFIGRVTLFFANNYLTEYRITMEFLHYFFRPWRNF